MYWRKGIYDLIYSQIDGRIQFDRKNLAMDELNNLGFVRG
jgi:hypothetical protein